MGIKWVWVIRIQNVDICTPKITWSLGGHRPWSSSLWPANYRETEALNPGNGVFNFRHVTNPRIIRLCRRKNCWCENGLTFYPIFGGVGWFRYILCFFCPPPKTRAVVSHGGWVFVVRSEMSRPRQSSRIVFGKPWSFGNLGHSGWTMGSHLFTSLPNHT
jgi:hypothetical protein